MNTGGLKFDALKYTNSLLNQMDYSKKTASELIIICKDNKIKGYSGKNRQAIIDLIESATTNTIVTTSDIISQDLSPDLSHIVAPVLPVGKKRIVSLFAGCGGLDYGFIKNDNYTHVLVNDFDVAACKTYENNFNIKPICGDVKQILEIPDCDLLIGGFPCQGFSMANPYRNENDTRNELYLEILRILKLKKPSYFLLENVKGLLNMGGYATSEDKKNRTGKIMKVILEDLKNCGYNVKFNLFEIKLYDVPQKRERVSLLV